MIPDCGTWNRPLLHAVVQTASLLYSHTQQRGDDDCIQKRYGQAERRTITAQAVFHLLLKARLTALALTNVRTVRTRGRGIVQLKWKHSSGTSATVRAPWVPEEWDPACSDGEENRDMDTGWFWKVVTSLWTLLPLDSRSRVSRTSSVMMCGWSSPLTIKVRYLARYSSCRAVEQRPPAKQYRARWVCPRECITLVTPDGFIEIFPVCGFLGLT